MQTQNETVQKIAELLHRSRSASWTSDHTLELSGAMKGQPPEVLALALLEYSQGLLKASRGVVSLQIDAAVTEALLDERDAAGGQLQ